MKQHTFLIAILFFPLFLIGQNITLVPKVNRTLELMTTVFRLSGDEEFINNNFEGYTSHIDRHFGRFNQHEVIKMAQRMKNIHHLSSKDVMELGLMISDENDVFSFQDNFKSNNVTKIFPKDSINLFVTLLNDFFTTSYFQMFFDHMEEDVVIAENNFSATLTAINYNEMIPKSKSKQPKSYQIFISLSNGNHHYFSHLQDKNGTELFFAIIGTTTVNEEDAAQYQLPEIEPLLKQLFDVKK